jgi:hypothetical protein
MKKQEDFYNLFPDCERCKQLRRAMNSIQNCYEDEITEGIYSEHLLKEHKLSRLEICDMTGVFIC